jgi:hypothetical protein
MAPHYSNISGTFAIAGAQNPSPGAVLKIGLSRNSGNRYRGTWKVDQPATEPRLNLSVDQGEWQLTGWCDDAGDHNNIVLRPTGSSSPLVTLIDVSSNFLREWICGSLFSGGGAYLDGTAIKYDLGVPCI